MADRLQREIDSPEYTNTSGLVAVDEIGNTFNDGRAKITVPSGGLPFIIRPAGSLGRSVVVAGLIDREFENEFAPFAGLAFHSDRASVLLHDFLAYGEAKTGAAAPLFLVLLLTLFEGSRYYFVSESLHYFVGEVARAMLGAYLGACARYVDLPAPEPRLS